jgi:hypothetical protein
VAEGWRVSVSVNELPQAKRRFDPRQTARDLHGRLNDDVLVSSTKTHLYLYADTADWAEEARHVVQDLLVQNDVSADVRLQYWDLVDQVWLDGVAVPQEDDAGMLAATHQRLQERERQQSEATGLPVWQVRVDLLSRQDVAALAGRLKAEGWSVVTRRKYLIAGANCEDDANGLAEEIRGYSGGGATIQVQRSIYGWSPNLIIPPNG